MKLRKDRDWTGPTAMAVMFVLALILAMMDPSCQRRADPDVQIFPHR